MRHAEPGHVLAVFGMADVRKTALAAHAAAREVKEDTAARSSARAAGQVIEYCTCPHLYYRYYYLCGHLRPRCCQFY